MSRFLHLRSSKPDVPVPSSQLRVWLDEMGQTLHFLPSVIILEASEQWVPFRIE